MQRALVTSCAEGVTLERAHDALVGRTLGEFVIRERIGEGGFGAVYRPIQPNLCPRGIPLAINFSVTSL